MAKIAGTESTANNRSTNSISTRARNSGVAQRTVLPVAVSGSRTQKALPRSPSVTRMRRLRNFRIGLVAMSGSWSAIIHILMPVNTRNAPNRYINQPKLLTNAAPRPIMMARSTITPRMPQNSTRCWNWRGMAKKLKISAITNTLSSDSDFSIRKPV